MIYILKFDEPLGTHKHKAEYYIGFCQDHLLDARLKHHACGRGAAITRAAAQRGIGWRVVVTLDGGRDLERALKAYKCTRRVVANLERKPEWRPRCYLS